MSTTEAAEKFLHARQLQGISSKTLKEYGYRLKRFAEAFSDLPLDAESIESFIYSIKGEIETRWDYRRDLNAFYNFLEKRLGVSNPMPDVARIKLPRKVRRVLSEEELRKLFDHTDSFNEKAILTLLIDSKIRASELVTLTRDKVFPDLIIVSGKTGERSVPISRGTYDMLIPLASSGYLFTVNGKPMRRRYLTILLRRLMQRAGLNGKKLGAHIIRHSASVQHIVHGGDLLSLSQELGHTTTRVTERYAQLSLSDVKRKHSQVKVLDHIKPKSRVPGFLRRLVRGGRK
ncbi:Tyrosine recombinase XerD [subsurface metagenome]